jgi:hypothetical protein
MLMPKPPEGSNEVGWKGILSLDHESVRAEHLAKKAPARAVELTEVQEVTGDQRAQPIKELGWKRIGPRDGLGLAKEV